MHKQKRWWIVSLILTLVMALSACAGFSTAQQPQMVYPTVVIVQYVTQVVATVTPAPPVTPQPPKAANPQPQKVLVNDGSYDPFAAPIYYPLKGCPVASRLKVGDVAFVANNTSVSGMHMDKQVGSSPLVRKFSAGELLNIIDGPYCARTGLVWEVSDAAGEKGFAAEGDGSTYWLLPFGQEVAADEMKPSAYVQLPSLYKPYGCRPR
jgi:hypothetical protein